MSACGFDIFSSFCYRLDVFLVSLSPRGEEDMNSDIYLCLPCRFCKKQSKYPFLH